MNGQVAISINPAVTTARSVLTTAYLALFVVALFILIDGTLNTDLWYYPVGLLAAVQLLPMYLGMIRGQIGFLEIFCLMRFGTYTVGKINAITSLGVGSLNASYLDTSRVIQEYVVCFAIIILTFYFVSFCLVRIGTRGIRYRLLVVNDRFYSSCVLFLILNPFFEGLISQSISSFAVLFQRMALVLILCARPKERPWLYSWTIALVSLSGIASLVLGGSMWMLLMVFLELTVIEILQRRLFRLAVLAPFFVLLVMIQSVKGDLRTVIYANPDMSLSERIELFAGLLTIKYIDGVDLPGEQRRLASEEDEEGEERAGELSEAFNRVLDDSLERVLAMTPVPVPYWDGSTFEPLLYMFVPRFAWPEKPVRTAWHEFGVKYGFLNENDDFTSITYNLFAEGYMNFGSPGLYGIAFVLGVLLALLELLSDWYFKKSTFFAAIVCLVPLLNVEIDFVSLIQTTTILILGMLCMRSYFRRTMSVES